MRVCSGKQARRRRLRCAPCFAARLASLYQDRLTARARVISETLKTVHKNFNSPLDDGVDAQLLDWGAHAIADTYKGLQGSYRRYLERAGMQFMPELELDLAYASAKAGVSNSSRHYLWELRNVPSKHPYQPVEPVPTQTKINNYGNMTIGAMQTGSSSTANVQQQQLGGDTSALRAALLEFCKALESAEDIELNARLKLISDVEKSVNELQQKSPSKSELVLWLSGIGAVVGALGSVQPAFEAVKSLARALGLPL